MSIYRIRRATTDDLAQLVALWQSLGMPALELEKRFTEFQIAEDDVNKTVGAIAMHMDGGEGRIHSETIPDFELTDILRPLLWERLKSVARNNGLFCIWIDDSAPFWKKDVGFTEASGPRLKELPASFGEPHPGWLMLQLRGEEAKPAAIEKQFELIMATQETERAATMRRAEAWTRQGKTIRLVAGIISALIFVGSLVALYLVMRRP